MPDGSTMTVAGRLAPRALGLAQAGLGVALLAVARGGTGLVSAVAAAGVVVAGLAALARRGGWATRAAGALLVLAGAVALVWRDASVRTLALVLGAALLAHGVALVVGHRDGTEEDGEVDGTPDRADAVARVLLGAASVALALVVLAWPLLSLHLVALLVGAWLVLTGLGAALRGGYPHLGVPARGWRRVLPAAAAVVVAGLALAGTAWVHHGDPRIAPDAFYSPPASVPAEPGALLRVRAMTDGVPDGLRAWLILYTTTDGAGEPAVASATVLAPPADAGASPAEAPAEGWPVIAVGHGTTGVVPRCAPSLAAEPFADGAGAALVEAVRAGHVAVTTDYVGLGTAGPHAYLVGPGAAHAVLDAVRAARRLDDVAVGDRLVAWGHSQGGHAVLWTGMLAHEYAPELDLLGVAAFAPASDLHALADDLRTEAIGKLVAAYIAASWDAAYPELDVRSQLTPTYRGVVDRIGDLCFTGRDVVAALATATQLSREVFAPGALDGPIGERLRANSPDGPIPVPVLLAQGDADPLVLPAQQAAYVARRCAAGTVLDARVYPGLDHLTLVAADSPLTPDLLAWTAARFAGEPAAASCDG